MDCERTVKVQVGAFNQEKALRALWVIVQLQTS